MTQTTSTRTVDRFGNVSYVIRRGDEVIGTVSKTCGGKYQADYRDSYVPNLTLKAARALIEARA